MKFANRQSGVVLIVVVGVLAVLSLLAVTFSRVMSIELRASANQADANLARQFAKAGLQFQLDILRQQTRNQEGQVSAYDGPNEDWHSMAQPDAQTTGICDTGGADNSYGCKVVYEDNRIAGAVSFHDHDSDRNDPFDSFFSGAGISDEDSKFNLNAMGSLEDVGTERDYRQRYSSFDASLARVIKASLDAEGIDINGGTDARYGFAVWLARRIARYRYGPSGRPGVAGDNDGRTLQQRPVFGLPYIDSSGNWQPATFTGDAGTGFPTAATPNTWQEIGAGFQGGGDGYANYFVDADNNQCFAEGGAWRTYTSSNDEWNDDAGVEILAGSGIGIGIRDRVPTGLRTGDGSLALEDGLVEYLEERVDLPTEFVPDADYIAAKHTDDPTYDDRLFRSNTEIIPIIREFIHELASASTGPLAQLDGRAVDVADEDSIDSAAKTIYDAISDKLTVHSYSWVGTSVNINGDWSMDGFDNNRNGFIDDDPRNTGTEERSWDDILDIVDPDEREDAIQARLEALREGLGLVDAAGNNQYGLDRKDINQIVVNIVDFADDNDIPTLFDDGADSVYGSEGLHITEVMGAGEKITSTTGDEMTDDGSGNPNPADNFNWDWFDAEDYWEMLDPDAIGTFEFDVPDGDGFYAIRLRGDDGDTLVIDPDGDNITATTDSDPEGVGEFWGYARNAAGNLYAVEVTGGKLTLEIEGGDVGDRFYGVQLLPQYIEITNIAQQGPHRNTDHSIDISGFSLQVTPSAAADEYIALPADQLVPPATGDGSFPINYGTYVVALSEDAYTQQWEIDPDDLPYPIHFVGDIDDDSADQMLFGPGNVSVALWDLDDNLIAGGEIDGSVDLDLQVYTSKEKNLILTDHSRDQSDWWDDSVAIPGDLSGSQHAEAYAGYRTNLNSVLDVWDGYPTFKSLVDFRDARQVFPIILNRPYASPGWLGLVPAGRPFRTIDRDPDPVNNPRPEQLLGRLMARATVGAVHARININTADWTVLAGIMDGSYDPDNPNDPALSYGSVKAVIDNRPFETWDDLLNTAALYDDTDTTHGLDTTTPFWRFYLNDRTGDGVYEEDSGAGTYGDDFPSDTDEQEEWVRRYSNLIDIRSHTFRTRVDGLVFDRDNYTRPAGHARLEAIIDRGRDTNGDGNPNPQILEMRYITP